MLLILCCCTPRVPKPPKVYKYTKGDLVQLKTGEPCIILDNLGTTWSHDYEVRITTPMKGSTTIWVYEYELKDSK